MSLELEAHEDDSLLLRITHDTSRLPQQQAVLTLQHFDAIINDLLSKPLDGALDLPCNNLDLISWKQPKELEITSPVKLVHEWVELQAISYPDRLALEFFTSFDAGQERSQQWSYRDLNDRSEIVASVLQQHDVHSRQNIAICFDKCPEASFAIIGILKAGCSFVAIDPQAPLDRVRFVLEDSGSTCVLSYGSLAEQLGSIASVPVLDLADTRYWAVEKPTKRGSIIAPSDVCYCLYTSGTTGTPKGCEITHENVVQALQSFQRLFHGHWDDKSRWLQFASFHFDVSVLEQFWSWSVGICVVSAPRDLIFEDIAFAIRRLEITHIDLTPSLAKLISPEDTPSLCRGVFITGGEKLQQEILDVWGHERVIYNGYGPTEATIGITMFPRVPKNGKPSNIGWQFDNVGTVVLKPGTESPVLRGAIGELCATGKLVGKGYLNRPELTSTRFPFLERWGGKAYRTGDLVRMLHDDTFDFVGRIDDQVKLRGQRLEIGEINHTIKDNVPAVRDLATLVVRHPSQQREQLICFAVISSSLAQSKSLELVHNQDASQAMKQAGKVCRDKLPPYMVPTQFIALNRLPLSVNNKIDANALKQWYSTLHANSLLQGKQDNDDVQTSLTANEAKIAVVVKKFLGLKSEMVVQPSTTVYELGVDSISIFSLAQAFKKADFPQATVSIIANSTNIFSF